MRDAAREVEAGCRGGAGRGQSAHAGHRRQEQHRGSDGRSAREAGLVARTGNRHAFLVGAGFCSRAFSGSSGSAFSRITSESRPIAAGAWAAAFRIPNFLQSLFGEGVLSASFIPVYAKLLARNEEEEAGRVAGAVAALLALVVSVLVLVGVLATPLFIDVIAAGFQGEARELTIRLVRILFPGAGLLVLSAWCLGILNSHRKFFLSYAAPVIWNVAMIAAMIAFGRRMDTNTLVDHRGLGVGGGQRPDVPGATSRRDAARSAHVRRTLGARARGHAELRARVREPRRGADQRLCRRMARELCRHYRGGGAHHRADALHPARQPLRHVDLRRRVAGNVGRRRTITSNSTAASTPACGRSRSSSCRQRWASLRWAM